MRGVKGSTRLEAKRQRRRDGRETTRRRAPILTESEFLARREAVDRVMVVRQTGERTQIAVLEDDMLVEHYVTRASATSYVGNVYLGRVQNVLPSMEAAFIDIGKGRNGVLYAGEVNWDAAGLEGKSRSIENALKSGDSVLVQVTKDPIGHKGARLTSQISLPGRFLVYVPGGGMTGISRRLPDTERHRLKTILKKIVPDEAGVIVRTAAEGASEEDLTRDVERLTSQWAAIEEAAAKAGGKGGNAPVLLHGEPDLAIRVVRDVFNEDFKSLVVQGDDAWQTVSDYVGGVAPDLAERVSKHTGNGDLFHDLRVDEQLMKALDRKVWLPSGGSLVIDRTEAMTVIDVNTGKFVGLGRQPRADGDPQQPRGGRGDRAPAAAARRRRHRRHRLHRHGARVEPRPRAAPADRVPRPRPHQAPGRRGHLARARADDPQAGRRGPARGVQRDLRALQRPRRARPHRAGRQVQRRRRRRRTTSGAARQARKRKRGGRGGAAARAVEPAATDEQRKAANAAIAAIHRAAQRREGRRRRRRAGGRAGQRPGRRGPGRRGSDGAEPRPTRATCRRRTGRRRQHRRVDVRPARLETGATPAPADEPPTGRVAPDRTGARRAAAPAPPSAPAPGRPPPPGREPPGRSAHGRASERVLPRQRSVP